MPSKHKQPDAVINRKEAERIVGGRGVLDLALDAGLLKIKERVSRKLVLFYEPDVLFVQRLILDGKFRQACELADRRAS